MQERFELYHYIQHNDLPGQGDSQSNEVSVSFPGHSSPPLWGGGLLQLLVRVTLLPPHDFAQADQLDQSDHWPLTGPAGKERILPPLLTLI